MYFARGATNNSLQSIKMITHTINAIDKLKNVDIDKEFDFNISEVLMEKCQRLLKSK